MQFKKYTSHIYTKLITKPGIYGMHNRIYVPYGVNCIGAGKSFKARLYRIWCGVHRLGDSGVHTLGDTSAFVNLAGQLLLIAG